MGFLNPLLFWGSVLVGVPILIYLISRRWYRRQDWAAMEFLLRALKKHRRRIQIENLLLLLIRISIILLLVLAMARPFLRSAFIGPLSKDEEVNWIFAIDTSFSMDFKDSSGNIFERALGMVADMVQNLVKNRDRMAICTLEGDPRVVLGPSTVTESNRAELLEGLEELKLGPQAVDLTRSLEVLRELASRFEPAGEGGPSILPKKIILLSDFQRKDWLGDDGPRDPAALGLIREIQDAGGAFALADLRTSDRNLSLLDLVVSPKVVARDVWIQFRATVRNWSREDFKDIELIFNIDGEEASGLVLQLPAGETLTSPWIPFRFDAPGYHPISAEIRSDGLSLDNRRHLALRVREEAGILLVDGEPAGSPLDRETLHLHLALSPDPSEAERIAEGRWTPYKPFSQIPDQLDDVDPRDYALVVLANVGYLPERFLESLKSYLREGGALMIFLGKNVDPTIYNQEFSGNGGEAILPGRLEEILGSSRDAFHLVPGDPDHPLVRYFEEHRELTSLLQPIVEFNQFYRVSLMENPSPGGESRQASGGLKKVRVAFRYNDPNASPAIFDVGFGQGRVMWMTSSADTEWNEFPKWPDFIAFIYESIPYLVQFGEARLNLSVGEKFQQVFDAAEYAKECLLVPPGTTRAIPKAMTRLEGENRFVITHEETWEPGIYQLRLSRPGLSELDGEESVEYFAVNTDPREGDLRPLNRDELSQHFSVLKAEIFNADRELREIGRQKNLERGTELWRHAIWIVLALLLAESALAQFFGRRVR